MKSILTLMLMLIMSCIASQALADNPEKPNEDKYDYYEEFFNGMAIVMLDKKYGFVNELGEEVVKPQYDSASPFMDKDVAHVMDCRTLRCKSGFIDRKGNVVVPLKYDQVSSFRDGLVKVAIFEDDPDARIKSGFVNKKGEEVIPLGMFGDASMIGFFEGLAVVEQDGRQGYINTLGEIVIPFDYTYADNFSEGMAYVETLDGRFGFTDKAGNFFSAEQFDSVISRYHEGMAKVKVNNKYGFINKKGVAVIPPKYEETSFEFNGGVASFKAKGKWGLLNKSGEEVVPAKYDNEIVFRAMGEVLPEDFSSLALVNIGCKYEPYEWNPETLVCKGGKWGYIDKSGNEVIPLQYDDASTFSDGKAWVSLNGESFYINKDNQRIPSGN